MAKFTGSKCKLMRREGTDLYLMYPLSLSGLISCYIAGLPFFGWTLVGNAFYCTMLFGSFEFASNKISVLQAR